MTIRTWTVTELLNGAINRLLLLQVDPRLAAAPQALCGELEQADTLALNQLRPDNTLPAGQRNARAQQIEDKVFALGTVEAAHKDVIGIDEFYTAMDMSDTAAGLIRRGLPSGQFDFAWRWNGQSGDPTN